MVMLFQGATTKIIILVTMCVQSAVYTVGRKHSVRHENVSSSEILLVAEILKLVVSAGISWTGDPSVSDAQGEGLQRLIWLILHSRKMIIVSAAYAAMNILSFVALMYIGSGEFIIIAQLKILSTAVASTLILRRRLSATKWRALVLLVLGCCLVSLSNNSNAPRAKSSERVLGYVLTLTEVTLSGCTSVFFEKVVKSTEEKVTVWERNFQLAVIGIFLYGAIIIYRLATSTSVVVGHNWTPFTVFVALLGASGGLLVAASLKHADSILKTIATAGAIVLASYLGNIFLGEFINLQIGIGSAIVIIAIANYTFDSTAAPNVSPLPTHTTAAELQEKQPSLLGRSSHQFLQVGKDGLPNGGDEAHSANEEGARHVDESHEESDEEASLLKAEHVDPKTCFK